MESKRKEPKALRTALQHTEENYIQLTEKQHADDRTFNRGKECPPQATPAAQKPLQATAQCYSACGSFRCEEHEKDYFVRDLPNSMYHPIKASICMYEMVLCCGERTLWVSQPLVETEMHS
jgi:hypothetical protein